jgi:hypothetical protein
VHFLNSPAGGATALIGSIKEVVMLRTGLTFALLASPFAVHAQDLHGRQHFLEGEEVLINTMMCDTVEQLESILQAQSEQGLEAGRAAYLALRATPNDMQEPTCLVAPYRLTMLDIAAEVPDVPTATGQRQTLYILYGLVNPRPYVILSPLAIEPPGTDV